MAASAPAPRRGADGFRRGSCRDFSLAYLDLPEPILLVVRGAGEQRHQVPGFVGHSCLAGREAGTHRTLACLSVSQRTSRVRFRYQTAPAGMNRWSVERATPFRRAHPGDDHARRHEVTLGVQHHLRRGRPTQAPAWRRVSLGLGLRQFAG